MLVGSHDGRVDHRVLVVGLLRQGFEDPLPDAALAPATVAQVHHPEVPETSWQIVPGDAGPVAIEHGIDEQAVVPGLCSGLAGTPGQQILDALPLIVAQRVSSGHLASSGISSAGFKLSP